MRPPAAVQSCFVCFVWGAGVGTWMDTEGVCVCACAGGKTHLQVAEAPTPEAAWHAVWEAQRKAITTLRSAGAAVVAPRIMASLPPLPAPTPAAAGAAAAAATPTPPPGAGSAGPGATPLSFDMGGLALLPMQQAPEGGAAGDAATAAAAPPAAAAAAAAAPPPALPPLPDLADPFGGLGMVEFGGAGAPPSGGDASGAAAGAAGAGAAPQQPTQLDLCARQALAVSEALEEPEVVAAVREARGDLPAMHALLSCVLLAEPLWGRQEFALCWVEVQQAIEELPSECVWGEGRLRRGKAAGAGGLGQGAAGQVDQCSTRSCCARDEAAIARARSSGRGRDVCCA